MSPIEILNLIKKNISWLRSVQLVKHSQSAHEHLLVLVKNPAVFTEEINASFTQPDSSGNFNLSEKEPSQIVLLKKVLNSLNSAQKSLAQLETIDLSKTEQKLQTGFGFDIHEIAKALQIAYHAIHDLIGIMQLVSDSDEAIKSLINPHIDSLLPQLIEGLAKLPQIEGMEIIANKAGEKVASIASQLPSERPKETDGNAQVSKLLAGLPEIFETMQQAIKFSDTALRLSSITSSEEYKATMKEKTDAIHADLNTISQGGGLWSLSMAAKKIFSTSSALVSTAAPLTAKAYLEAVNSLNTIRHDYIPELINELEHTEESLGLTSGVLVNPALKTIDTYYRTVVEQVQKIAVAGRVIEDTADLLDTKLGQAARWLAGDTGHIAIEKIKPANDLDNLQDEPFFEKRNAARLERWNNYQYQSLELNLSEKAAEQFFEKLNQFFPAFYNHAINELSIAARLDLANDYKQFQHVLAQQDPSLDKQLVSALKVSHDQRLTFIKSLEFSHDEKERLAQTLDGSRGETITYCIKMINESRDKNKRLNADKLQELKAALSLAPDERGRFARAVRSIPTPTPVATGVLDYLGWGINQTFRVARFTGNFVLPTVCQFATVQQAKANVLGLIKTAIVDTDFSVRAIERSATQADDQLSAYRKQHGYKTSFNTVKEPMRPLSYTDKRTRAGYRDAYLALMRQDNEIKKAEFALSALFSHVEKTYQGTDPVISELAESETLFQLYKQAQPYIACQYTLSQPEKLPGTQASTYHLHCAQVNRYNQLNRDADNAFVTAFKDKSSTRLSDLSHFRVAIEAKLSALKAQTRQDIDKTLVHYSEARAGEIINKTLDNSTAHKKSTLIGRIHDLDLSSKIDSFITDRFVPFLNTNLLTAVSSRLQTSRIESLLETSGSDAQQIILYKKLYQSMHHLQQGLKNIETLAYLENETWITGRTMSVIALRAMKNEIIRSIALMEEAYQNPGLQTLIEPLKTMIEPLMPLIGRNEEAIILRQTLQDKAADYLTKEKMLANLFKLPETIKQYNSNDALDEEHAKKLQKQAEEQAQALIKSLGSLHLATYPDAARNILKASTELQQALAGVGVESRTALLTHIKRIRSEFGLQLVLAADDAEFNLGLKPGYLSEPVLQHIDAFYESLVNMAAITEQEKFTLLVDTSLEQARIEHEEKRLESIQTKITDEPDNKALETLRDDLEEFIRDNDDLAFDKQDSSKLAIKVRGLVNNKLEALQIKFLTAFAELQPALAKIDVKYEEPEFLKLKTDDIQTKAKNILTATNNMLASIQSQHNINKINTAICHERASTYLRPQLLNKNLEGRKKIELFKRQSFERCLDKKINAQLPELGAFKDVGLKLVKAHYTIPIGLLDTITNQDNIEETISSKLSDTLVVDAGLNAQFNLLSHLNEALQRLTNKLEQLADIPHENAIAVKQSDALRIHEQKLRAMTEKKYVQDAVSQCNDEMKVVINDMDKSDDVINIYTCLQNMEAYLKVNTDSHNQEKLKTINAMQTTLNNLYPDAYKGLQSVQAILNDKMDVLQKGTDNVFVYMVKVFANLLASILGLQVDCTGYEKRSQVNNLKSNVLEGLKKHGTFTAPISKQPASDDTSEHKPGYIEPSRGVE